MKRKPTLGVSWTNDDGHDVYDVHIDGHCFRTVFDKPAPFLGESLTLLRCAQEWRRMNEEWT